MDEADQRLVAEIIVGSSRGSGFLIAPGIILTALHVVLGDAPPELVPDEARAEVRLFGDVLDAVPPANLGWSPEKKRARLAAARIPWHGAKLVWPRPGSASYTGDIALLQLDDPAVTSLVPPTELSVAVGKRREVGCVAGGFPTFRAEGQRDEEIWELYALEGQLDASARRGDTARMVDVTSAGLPDDVDGWRGMSGAALWIDSEAGCAELVGVMHALVGALKSNDVLLYWPLSAVAADDPDFWRLTGLKPPGSVSAAPAPAVAATTKPLVAQLADNFFRFDRASFSDTFRSWLMGDIAAVPRDGLPCRPVVVVLRGHRVDEPALCAQRFADILAAEAWPERAALYAAPLQLDCGPVLLPVASRVRTLHRQWAQHYSEARLTLTADVPAIIRAGLGDSGRARCVLIEHASPEFTDGCRDVIAGALEPLRSWQPDAAGATPPVVLLSILTGSDPGPSDDAFTPARCFPGKTAQVDAALSGLVAATPELEWAVAIPDLGAELAHPPNVGEWLAEIVRVERNASLPAGIGAEIELRLRPHIAFPIAFARAAVDRVILAQRS